MASPEVVDLEKATRADVGLAWEYAHPTDEGDLVLGYWPVSAEREGYGGPGAMDNDTIRDMVCRPSYYGPDDRAAAIDFMATAGDKLPPRPKTYMEIED